LKVITQMLKNCIVALYQGNIEEPGTLLYRIQILHNIATFMDVFLVWL